MRNKIMQPLSKLSHQKALVWGLKSLIEVRSERVTNDKSEKGVLYYGSSRTGTPEQFGNWIRSHWDSAGIVV